MSNKAKFIGLTARLSGEMKVEDIPVAGWADTKALTKGDDDPLEVVMAVPAGKSTRGWNYTENALSSIVGEVNSVGLPGFLGHQKAENVATEFPQPVTHWIGAKMQNGVAYFRGLIDKSAPDLKRWVRGKAVSQVSIYGYPQLAQNAVTGETDVTDYKGLSIDWTPLNRAGMPTSVAALSGEMDTVIADKGSMSHETLHEKLRGAAIDKLGAGADAYVGIDEVYDDYFVAYKDTNSDGTLRHYRIAYSKDPDKGDLILGEPKEVQRKVMWEPTGEMKKGEEPMKKEIKDLLEAGTITQEDLKAACGEMQDAGKSKEAQPEQHKASEFEKACGEMFGGKAGDDLLKAIQGASKLAAEAKAKDAAALVDKAIKAKVSGEMAQSLVKKLLHVEDGATEEAICGEIDSILADETVKAVLAQAHVDSVPPTGAQEQSGASGFFTSSMTAL